MAVEENSNNTLKDSQTGDTYLCNVYTTTYMFEARTTTALTKPNLAVPKDRPHSCEICKKTFTLKGNMKRHMLTHTGERPYGCSICTKRFIQQSNLKMHLLTHTNECPFACNICQKAFKQKYFLKRHMMIHTGERPFTCPICNKSFRQKSHLKTHALLHSGDRPHNCDICGKRFVVKSRLKTHFLSHTKIRHTCDICNKCFTLRSHLKGHLQAHATEGTGPCALCGKICQNSCILKMTNPDQPQSLPLPSQAILAVRENMERNNYEHQTHAVTVSTLTT